MAIDGTYPYSTTGARLTVTPERRLLPTAGGPWQILFTLNVDKTPEHTRRDRMPVSLALVVDRSGSMQGEKIETAKRAVSAVLDRLEERDHVAVVIFDHQVEVLQAPAPVTAALRAAIRGSLSRVQARGNTALHEGWLTGCTTIADEGASARAARATRCFLLTDGQANEGLTDPEAIATQAADILSRTGLGTSTFGIGDYNEHLLAPLAVAGGGAFHHLRSSAEIANTFIGELGELLAVSARRVRLEVELDPGMRLEVISEYRLQADNAPIRWSIMIGDLQSGEERQVVVRCMVPPLAGQSGRRIRARLVWDAHDSTHQGPWQEVSGTYAEPAAYAAEAPAQQVTNLAGEHGVYRAQYEATRLAHAGNVPGAVSVLKAAAAAVPPAAPMAGKLREELSATETQLDDKNVVYNAIRRSKGQRDLRQP